MGAEVLETESVEYKRVSEKKKQLQIMIHEMKADIRKKESLISELEDDLRKMPGGRTVLTIAKKCRLL